jgi:hypothetical protein
MKNKLLITILLFIPTLNSFSQDLIPSGAKSYNLYINNPALIAPEDKSQIDFLGGKQNFWSDLSSYTLFANTMFKLKKSNIRVSFLEYSFSGLERQRGGTIGYSYNKDLNDKFSLSGGIDLNFFRKDNSGFYHKGWYSSSGSSFVSNIKWKDNYLHSQLGIATKYNDLTIGVNSKFGIWNDVAITSTDPNFDKGIQLFRINFLVKYDFKVKDNIIITPQIEYLHNHIFTSEKDYNIGLFFNYKKLIGFGFMFDSDQAKLTEFRNHVYNFSTQIKLFKKVDLIGVYSPIFYEKRKSTDKNAWNAQLQLRIEL